LREQRKYVLGRVDNRIDENRIHRKLKRVDSSVVMTREVITDELFVACPHHPELAAAKSEWFQSSCRWNEVCKGSIDEYRTQETEP
jgi:hypothetical protein